MAHLKVMSLMRSIGGVDQYKKPLPFPEPGATNLCTEPCSWCSSRLWPGSPRSSGRRAARGETPHTGPCCTRTHRLYATREGPAYRQQGTDRVTSDTPCVCPDPALTGEHAKLWEEQPEWLLPGQTLHQVKTRKVQPQVQGQGG